MSDSPRIDGTNFSSPSELSAVELSKALCRISSFVQSIDPYIKLDRYDDWWEHDGLHFRRNRLTVEDLFSLVGTPRSVLESMSGDEDVFVGILDTNRSFYLRFYLTWSDDDSSLVGRFDITFVDSVALRFKDKVLAALEINLREADATEYYKAIAV